jgi:hypothetical protein
VTDISKVFINLTSNSLIQSRLIRRPVIQILDQYPFRYIDP